MKNCAEIQFWFEIVLTCASGCFLCVLWIRLRALHTVAEQNMGQISHRVKNGRILLQCINILVYCCLIVIESFWGTIMHMSENWLYSLVWVLPVATSASQIYVENYEFSMKIPLMFYHKIFWFFQFLISTACLILLFLSEDTRFNNYDDPIRLGFLVSRVAVQLLLNLYTIYRAQDITEFMNMNQIIWDLDHIHLEQPFLSSLPHATMHINSQSYLHSQSMQEHSINNLTDEQEIQVTFVSGLKIRENIPSFKLRVKINPKDHEYLHHSLEKCEYEISKELNEFIQLQADLQQEISTDPTLNEHTKQDIAAFNLRNFENTPQIDYNQAVEIKETLKGLFTLLCKNRNTYYISFINFLNLDIQYKHHFQQLRLLQCSNIRSLPCSIHSERFGQNFSPQVNQSMSIQLDKQEGDYFRVIIDQSKESSEEYVRYDIKIKNLQNGEYQLLKMRYSELRALNNTLKEIFAHLPPFPQKKFISLMGPKFLLERQEKLQLYLEVLLNEEEFNQNGVLFDQLQRVSQKNLFNPLFRKCTLNKEPVCNYHLWRAQSSGHFIQMENGEMKGFTVYRFVIFEGDFRRGVLEKRFKEFVKLHEYLSLKSFSQQLPHLPPKISNFNTNIPMERRQQDLQAYLDKLFIIPEISKSYFFKLFFRSVSQPLPSSPSIISFDFKSSAGAEERNNFTKGSSKRLSFGSGEDNNDINSLKIDELHQFGQYTSPTV